MSAVQRIQAAIDQASAGLVGRRPVIELLALAAVARQHVLVLGPPGTAKSELVRRFALAVSAQRFEYLLGRFTEPSELFGPVDLIELREGRLTTRTEGMLPEAELAFLDEVFLGSTAILNTLLGLLAERTFRRGHDVQQVPLRLCVGASNERPTSPELAAFADRFALTAHVEPVENARLEELLESAAELPRVDPVASIADIDSLAAEARRVDVAPVRAAYADAIRTLRTQGVRLSDRRVVQGQRTIAAAAALDGRTEATSADLWPLVFLVPDAEGQHSAREVLKDALAGADSATLGAAAELASHSLVSRARRIVEQANTLLSSDDVNPLALEAVAREIDSTFPADARPSHVADARDKLAAALSA